MGASQKNLNDDGIVEASCNDNASDDSRIKPDETPAEPIAETFWQTVCKVMPWAFGAALTVVGGTLAIAVVLPKLAALATAWGLTAKAMAVMGYVQSALTCISHCAQFLFNLLISLQGQVLLGMFTFTAELGATAAIVAGAVMTLLEGTIIALTLGVFGRSITNSICNLFGLNKPKATDSKSYPDAMPKSDEDQILAADAYQGSEAGENADDDVNTEDAGVTQFPSPRAN